MNRIFKVIWSKAKNMWVVASELAKSHTKSPKSGVMSRALVAGVLACVLSFGAVMPVYSANQTVDGNLTVTGTSALRGGTTIGTSSANANLRVNGNETVTGNLTVSGDILKTAIGSGAVVATSSAVAVGLNANANTNSIAIGSGADASEKGQSIAIGTSAIAKTTNSITIGDHSRNYGINSIILGSSGESGNLYSEIAEGVSFGVLIGENSVIRGSHSNSLGNYTYIDSASSVALGDYSVAQEDNVVSFGHRVGDTTVSGLYNDDLDKVYSENLTRRLINVSDGINDTDVATWGQTKVETRPADNGNYVAGFSAS